MHVQYKEGTRKRESMKESTAFTGFILNITLPGSGNSQHKSHCSEHKCIKNMGRVI